MGKTKVFVSCGQRDNSEEIVVANKIKDFLLEENYDVYVAKEIQSLSALTNEIFQQIESSEYFLFVDFKRELCVDEAPKVTIRRGSLFSHQELAVAAYLKKDCLIFKHEDVGLEGVQKFLITNPITFMDINGSSGLLEKLKEQVRNNWKPGWKDELSLELAKPIFEEAVESAAGELLRFYHLTIKNKHKSKLAQNVRVYLLDIDCGLPTSLKRRNIEAVWAGYGITRMDIMPKDSREIDLFIQKVVGPRDMILLHTITTSGHYQPAPIRVKNISNIKIEVYCDNFPTIVKTVGIKQDAAGQFSYEFLN